MEIKNENQFYKDEKAILFERIIHIYIYGTNLSWSATYDIFLYSFNCQYIRRTYLLIVSTTSFLLITAFEFRFIIVFKQINFNRASNYII